jgi:hypothetical protein
MTGPSGHLAGRVSVHPTAFTTAPAPNLMSSSGVVYYPAMHIFDTGWSGISSFKLLAAKFGVKPDA